jgi:glycosyltransferase involved in cell wall biosynthesis
MISTIFVIYDQLTSSTRGSYMVETSIILATYNGEKFIGEFLKSLADQTYKDFEIIVGDDRSSDGTIGIIRSFEKRLDIRLSVNQMNLGPSLNFSEAAKRASGQFIFFADQDDVWHSDKLEIMTETLRRFSDAPVLVFSDLEIVDADLSTIQRSYFAAEKSRDCGQIQDFIVSGHIPGCAMAVNRQLLDLALPVPANFRMHDWWLSMVAATQGSIKHLPLTLVKYRQHEANTYGVDTRPKKNLIQALATPFGSVARKLSFLSAQASYCRENVKIFRDHNINRLQANDREIIDTFMAYNAPRKRLKILNSAKLGRNKYEAMIVGLMI